MQRCLRESVGWRMPSAKCRRNRSVPIHKRINQAARNATRQSTRGFRSFMGTASSRFDRKHRSKRADTKSLTRLPEGHAGVLWKQDTQLNVGKRGGQRSEGMKET